MLITSCALAYLWSLSIPIGFIFYQNNCINLTTIFSTTFVERFTCLHYIESSLCIKDLTLLHVKVHKNKENATSHRYNGLIMSYSVGFICTGQSTISSWWKQIVLISMYHRYLLLQFYTILYSYNWNFF